MNKKIELAMAISIIFCAFVFAQKGVVLVQSLNANDASKTIVIDAGHGGSDPGKIGINGELEKDLNLEIALLLKSVLESNHFQVVLTRDSDIGLHSENATNKKVEDMQNRCKLIADTNPVFTISIHQNSYTSESIKGAQVFYYGQSEDGKRLAETIQSHLIQDVDPENHRTAKANESYYLLKKTPTPTVIVECGFLSNSAEAELLSTTDYQKKLVNAIYLGVAEYLGVESDLENSNSEVPSTNSENAILSDTESTELQQEQTENGLFTYYP